MRAPSTVSDDRLLWKAPRLRCCHGSGHGPGHPPPLAGFISGAHLTPLTPPRRRLPESPAATCLHPQTTSLDGCPTVRSSRLTVPTARRTWSGPGTRRPWCACRQEAQALSLSEKPQSVPHGHGGDVAGAVPSAPRGSARGAPLSMPGSPQFFRRGN